jgi:hypothetical protein
VYEKENREKWLSDDALWYIGFYGSTKRRTDCRNNRHVDENSFILYANKRIFAWERAFNMDITEAQLRSKGLDT